MTVGDFLDWHLARYPEHELVLKRTSFGSARISLPPPGTTRQKQFPLLAAIYQFFGNSWRVIGFVGGVLVLLKGVVVMRTWDLRRVLRLRGYTSLTYWGAERIYIAMGSKAWRLPAFDELAALPDVNPADVDSLVEFMAEMRYEQSLKE